MTDAAPDYRQVFDAAADGYDTYASGIDWTPNAQLAQALAVIRWPDRVRSVLDLGTGTGQTLDVVHARFPRARLSGVDLSPAMLERAAAKIPSAHLVAADLVTFVTRLSSSFDLVTAVGCTEFVADLPDLLARLRPHVNDEGWIAVTIEVPGPVPTGAATWTSADVLEPMTGYELVEHRRFRGYRRAGSDVPYELLLLRAPEPRTT